MAFTMSLDDFVISYFVYGPNFVTLPVEIYNYTKKPLQPKIYALFTLLFLVILALMVLMNLCSSGMPPTAERSKNMIRERRFCNAQCNPFSQLGFDHASDTSPCRRLSHCCRSR